VGAPDRAKEGRPRSDAPKESGTLRRQGRLVDTPQLVVIMTFCALADEMGYSQ